MTECGAEFPRSVSTTPLQWTTARAATKNGPRLGNSQCSVGMKPVGVTLSGTNPTLNLAITSTGSAAVQLCRIGSNQLKAEWHGRELRIGADGAQHDRLFHSMTAAALNQLDPHQGVLVEEPAGAVPIRADAADQRGRVNHQLGMEFAKQPFDIVLARQIAIFIEGHGNLAASDLPQPFHNVRAKEAGAPGSQDALRSQIMSRVLPPG